MSQLSNILHGDSKSGSNNKSFIARLGQLGQKYTDPLAWAFGRKYTDKLVDVADFSNKQLSTVVKPFAKVDKTINPFRRFNVVPGVNSVKDWTEAKPADTVAAALGGYYAGGAALGGSGGGAGGGLETVGSGAYANGAVANAGLGANSLGGAAGGAMPEVIVSASGSSAAPVIAGAAGGAGAATAENKGFDWQKFAKQGMGGQQQQQGQPNDWYAQYLKQQEELRKQALIRQQIAAMLAQQQGQQAGVTYGAVP